MNYLEFRNALLPFKVFSIWDAKKQFSNFDTRRLVEWQAKGYILKIINGWYLFTEVTKDDNLINRVSNCLHQPSYISLESAFAFYNLIPEAVFTCQSVTTNKTQMYHTSIGDFVYRSVKQSLYFGYSIFREGMFPVCMAEKEKALLDYFYLNTHFNKIVDFEELRFNIDELANLDWGKMNIYLEIFDNKQLTKRVTNFKLFLQYA